MTQNRSATGGLLLSLAALIVVVAGLKAASSLVVPLLMSLFLAVICSPPLHKLQERGVPSGLALLIVLLGIIIVAMGLVFFVGNSVNQFTDNLPFYQQQLQERLAGLVTWLDGFGLKIDLKTVSNYFDTAKAMKMLGSLVAGLGSVLTSAVFILLTVIFMLAEAAGFPTKIKAAFAGREDSLPNMGAIAQSLERYTALKTLVSLMTGVAVSVWLAIQGVDYPVLWGLLAFLFNFVPNIGSIIAAVPAVVLAFVQLGGGAALVTALGYLLINGIVGNFIEPKLMGQRMGLSTLVVFLSLVFWGWVLGPVGMVLSVPLTMTMKIILQGNENTRWIAILLGSEDEAREILNKEA